jgi:hypothetical protein
MRAADFVDDANETAAKLRKSGFHYQDSRGSAAGYRARARKIETDGWRCDLRLAF